MRAIERPPDIVSSGSPPRTDHELMRASALHPEEFAEIFDRHASAIHHYLSRRVGDLADDLLSETFLTAFRKRDSYRAERLDVRPWLYGIAGNLIRRHQRAEAARYRALARSGAKADPTSAGEHEDAVDRADARRTGPRLAAALAELNAGDREVLVLMAWGDLTQSEVSAALGIPMGTVRSRLHRARTRVREHLGQAGPATDRTLSVIHLPETSDHSRSHQ